MVMSCRLSPAYVGDYDKKEDQMTKGEDKKTDGNEGDETPWLDPRKQLLARVAAHVAASVVAAPSKKATSPAAIAEISVDIAEAILQRSGL